MADVHKMLEELSRNVAELDASLREAKKQKAKGKKGLRYLVCLWRASKQHPRWAASGGLSRAVHELQQTNDDHQDVVQNILVVILVAAHRLDRCQHLRRGNQRLS